MKRACLQFNVQTHEKKCTKILPLKINLVRMKKKLAFYTFIITATFPFKGIAQTDSVIFEVATWHGFRSAAICYTFDDGCSNQFSKARPMFDTAHFPMTLYTVTNWSPNWKVLQNMSEKGHEIGSHSVNHIDLNKADASTQNTELKNSKVVIEQNIKGSMCLTHAYPYCTKAIDSIVSKYYISARGCQGFIENKTPIDYNNVSSIVVGELGSIKVYVDFKNSFINVSKKNGWLVFLIHGIDNDGGYSPISSTELKKSLDYLTPRTSKYWVTTFKNATLYSKERNAAIISNVNIVDTAVTFDLSDNLLDSIYNFPLSLRSKLPNNWPSAKVTQNDIEVTSRIVKVDSTVYLQFDVVPDKGLIKVIKSNIVVVPEVDTIPPDNEDPESVTSSIENLPDSPFFFQVKDNKLIIHLPEVNFSNNLWHIKIYDFIGRIVLSKKISVENTCIVDLPSNIKNGTYLFELQNSTKAKVYKGKFIV
jgi:oligosaccharide reducing-end xylanase